MDDGVAALEPAAPGRAIHVHRIGCCLLHVLHLSVKAGMENVFFMDPLGKSTLQYHRNDVVLLFLHPLIND